MILPKPRPRPHFPLNPDAYLLGLDIGTSGAKAALVDAGGSVLAWAGREYPIHAPRAGWAEQDPADWLSAALDCTREAMQKAGVYPREVAAIGLTGQMHSLTPVGADGNPVRPAIIWADQRSALQVERLTRQIGRENLAAWAGNPLAAGFMLASWQWMRENEPENVKKTQLLMLPKDFVRLKLTGKAGAEPSDASSTLLFDPRGRAWSRPLMEVAGLTADRLPPISESSMVAGGLREEMARACSLPSGTPVVFGCSDVTAQALAMGVIAPGTVSATIGTGGQLFAPIPEPRGDPHLRMHLFCHALPHLWHYEAAILSAGLSLRWLRDQVWSGSEYGEMADEAAKASAAADGLFFLPFLAGERTPYMIPGLQGAFLGLTLSTGRAELARAVMEGVVFALRQCLDLMASLGVSTERLLASGGATRHPLWLELESVIFNRTLRVFNDPEATSKGAALLAGLGTGVYASAPQAIERFASSPGREVTPDRDKVRLYEEAYQKWKRWANLIAGEYHPA